MCTVYPSSVCKLSCFFISLYSITLANVHAIRKSYLYHSVSPLDLLKSETVGFNKWSCYHQRTFYRMIWSVLADRFWKLQIATIRALSHVEPYLRQTQFETDSPMTTFCLRSFKKDSIQFSRLLSISDGPRSTVLRSIDDRTVHGP